MPPKLPLGPMPLLAALVAYGDPAAVADRRAAEKYIREPILERHADFLLTRPEDRDTSQVYLADDSGGEQLNRTRERLVAALLDHIFAERVFLRGIPTGMLPGAPNELIPGGWAMELELRIGDSSVRRLTDRWVSVTATAVVPRADELAAARALVEASQTASVGHMPDGAHPLGVALLRLSTPAVAGEFQAVETEFQGFRQLAAGIRPPGVSGVVLGLDAVGRDLAEHRLMSRRTSAKAALLTDFVTRVQDGRVLLTGLQSQPTLAVARSELSADWARHMVFDWDRNAVRVFDSVFVDVQGSARKPRPPKKPPAVRAKAATGRGRPKFPFEILVEIAATPGWRRAQHNTREAEALLAEFRRRHPMTKEPALSTVVSHVGEVYAAAAQAAATLKSSKSK